MIWPEGCCKIKISFFRRSRCNKAEAALWKSLWKLLGRRQAVSSRQRLPQGLKTPVTGHRQRTAPRGRPWRQILGDHGRRNAPSWALSRLRSVLQVPLGLRRYLHGVRQSTVFQCRILGIAPGSDTRGPAHQTRRGYDVTASVRRHCLGIPFMMPPGSWRTSALPLSHAEATHTAALWMVVFGSRAWAEPAIELSQVIAQPAEVTERHALCHSAHQV